MCASSSKLMLQCSTASLPADRQEARGDAWRWRATRLGPAHRPDFGPAREFEWSALSALEATSDPVEASCGECQQPAAMIQCPEADEKSATQSGSDSTNALSRRLLGSPTSRTYEQSRSPSKMRSRIDRCSAGCSPAPCVWRARSARPGPREFGSSQHPRPRFRVLPVRSSPRPSDPTSERAPEGRRCASASVVPRRSCQQTQ